MSYQNYTDTLQGVRKGAGYLAQVREKFPHAVLEEVADCQPADHHHQNRNAAGSGGVSVLRLRRLAAGAVG